MTTPSSSSSDQLHRTGQERENKKIGESANGQLVGTKAFHNSKNRKERRKTRESSQSNSSESTTSASPVVYSHRANRKARKNDRARNAASNSAASGAHEDGEHGDESTSVTEDSSIHSYPRPPPPTLLEARLVEEEPSVQLVHAEPLTIQFPSQQTIENFRDEECCESVPAQSIQKSKRRNRKCFFVVAAILLGLVLFAGIVVPLSSGMSSNVNLPDKATFTRAPATSSNTREVRPAPGPWPGPATSSPPRSEPGPAPGPAPANNQLTPGPTAIEAPGSAPASYRSTPGPTASMWTPGPTRSIPTPGPTAFPATPGPTGLNLVSTPSPTPLPTDVARESAGTENSTMIPRASTTTSHSSPLTPAPLFQHPFLSDFTLGEIEQDFTSPQARALIWVESHPEYDANMPRWRRRQLMALGTLFYSTGLDDVLHSWNPEAHECDWRSNGFVSECTQDGRYRSLYLRADALAGQIPPEISFLQDLSSLSMGENRGLSGNLPSELGLMTALTFLDLKDNQLNGPVPSQLEDLSNLRHLYLLDNDLTGEIPAQLCNSPSLQVLVVDCQDVTCSCSKCRCFM